MPYVVYHKPDSKRISLLTIHWNLQVEMHVPTKLREKVNTFYKMYWHKQKGMSGSVLMPTFPPTTFNLIYSEIYFEAQQKVKTEFQLVYLNFVVTNSCKKY